MGDPEIEAQEDENITHTAVVSQEPLPGTTNRIKIPILNKQVFFIHLTTLVRWASAAMARAARIRTPSSYPTQQHSPHPK
jgi:hypothetical protein